MIGIIGLAYGLVDNEPSRNNRQLAMELELTKFALGQVSVPIVTIAQWEISLAMPTPPDHVIWPYRNRYLSSADVIGQAAAILEGYGTNRAVLITRAGLHRFYSQELARHAGLEVVGGKNPGRLPYDPDSLQWWTRGPTRELVHAMVLKLTGRTGRFIATSQLLDLAR